MTLQVRLGGNVIVFAFKEYHRALDWARLEVRASTLTRRLGLDFLKYVRRIALDQKQLNWQDVFARGHGLSG
jgi:hypothetical protein